MAEDFTRLISFLELLALTFPAVVIYIQTKVPELRELEGNSSDDKLKPLKRTVVLSEISLLFFGLATIGLLINATSVQKGEIYDLINRVGPFVIFLGYSFWLSAIGISVSRDFHWLN